MINVARAIFGDDVDVNRPAEIWLFDIANNYKIFYFGGSHQEITKLF